MLPYEDALSLPLFYHLNSEPWLNQAAYADPTAVAEFLPVADPERAVRLPPPGDDTGYASLLARRRSCRRFAHRSMPLPILSRLLWNAYGVIDVAPRDNGVLGMTRPVPSAGGLYPLELRVAARSVAGLEDGVYRYNVLHRCLEPVALPEGLDAIGEHLLAQYFVQQANLLFFLSAHFARTLRKYGARGYRYILLEAGHVAQNLCLTATELGLGSLCIGGYRDGALNTALGLDEQREAVVYCVGVGYEA